MIPYQTFAVLGGDLRQVHIANRLSAQGKTVYAMQLERNRALKPELACRGPLEETLKRCEVILLPLPMTLDGQTINAPFSEEQLRLEDCFRAFKPGTIVLAGRIGSEQKELADRYGVKLIDYLEREELALHNARITAEGALAIALEELPTALYLTQCLVTGHGRVAKEMIRVLTGIGAKVTVAARKYADFAQIRLEGCEAVPMTQLDQAARQADVIFNTVPAHLFTREILSRLKPEALLIDLASRPGGIDLDAAGELGVKTIWALSLPGKCAPLSAGEMILQTMENCLREQEAQ